MTSHTIADVMTPQVTSVQSSAPASAAAQAMRDNDIGDVLVMDADTLYGVCTDRDLVVRVMAAGLDPSTTPVGDVCSRSVESVTPENPVDDAIRMMRDRAIRRLPVVDDGGRTVGVVSLGDLAMVRDPKSVLGDISSAPPNR